MSTTNRKDVWNTMRSMSGFERHEAPNIVNAHNNHAILGTTSFAVCI